MGGLEVGGAGGAGGELLYYQKGLVLPQEAKRQLREKYNYSLGQPLIITDLIICTLFYPPTSYSQVKYQTQKYPFSKT